MSRTENSAYHPIEIALAAAIVTAEAVIMLVTALIALALVATGRVPRDRSLVPAPAPLAIASTIAIPDLQKLTAAQLRELAGTRRKLSKSEVGAFYWTVPAPDIVNSGREEQGSISV